MPWKCGTIAIYSKLQWLLSGLIGPLQVIVDTCTHLILAKSTMETTVVDIVCVCVTLLRAL